MVYVASSLENLTFNMVQKSLLTKNQIVVFYIVIATARLCLVCALSGQYCINEDEETPYTVKMNYISRALPELKSFHMYKINRFQCFTLFII